VYKNDLHPPIIAYNNFTDRTNPIRLTKLLRGNYEEFLYQVSSSDFSNIEQLVTGTMNKYKELKIQLNWGTWLIKHTDNQVLG
jgi:hypothetical protein